MLDVQKHLNIRGYHIADVHLEKFVESYPVTIDFPFVERFNEIIHWMRNAGLYEKWLRDDQARGADNFYKKTEFLKNREQMEIEGFTVPMFIFYGWFVGTVAFVIEISCKNVVFHRFVTGLIKRKRNFNSHAF